MADHALLKILLRGTDDWNEWRRDQLNTAFLDFTGANLAEANLAGANLAEADPARSSPTRKSDTARLVISICEGPRD